MAENKTKETQADVAGFITSKTEGQKREDSFRLVEILEKITGFPAKMWGPTIIGFGSYHYRYASGHEGDAPLAGFSPRKDSLALYFSPEFENKEELLAKFGKHKAAKACIYVKKLADIDLDVFEEMTRNSIAFTQALYPVS